MIAATSRRQRQDTPPEDPTAPEDPTDPPTWSVTAQIDPLRQTFDNLSLLLDLQHNPSQPPQQWEAAYRGQFPPLASDPPCAAQGRVFDRLLNKWCIWHESDQRYIYDPDSEGTHIEVPFRSNDPYRTHGSLGHGSYGSVDKVESRFGDGRLFARKISHLPARGPKRKQAVDALADEARITAKLRSHWHVVKIIETFQWGNRFGIVMLPVAEHDLSRLLEYLDDPEPDMERDTERVDWLASIPRMACCLVRALEFVHANNVRHKDIIPSNILVSGGNILLADFGIAKEVTEPGTTGTTGDLGPRSKEYCAPEANHEDQRRSRASDIFSLGCVILELITVLCGPLGALQRLREHLRAANHPGHKPTYSASPDSVFQWVCFLFLTARSTNAEREARLCYMAYLMLAPKARERPTAVGLTQSFFYTGVLQDLCAHCSRIADIHPLVVRPMANDTLSAIRDFDHKLARILPTSSSPVTVLDAEASQSIRGAGWTEEEGVRTEDVAFEDRYSHTPYWFWACCSCSQLNSIDVAPYRCAVCVHAHCANCTPGGSVRRKSNRDHSAGSLLNRGEAPKAQESPTFPAREVEEELVGINPVGTQHASLRESNNPTSRFCQTVPQQRVYTRRAFSPLARLKDDDRGRDSG